MRGGETVMELEECRLNITLAYEKGKGIKGPVIGIAITVAPTDVKARELALEELKKYLSDDDFPTIPKREANILFMPIPTTVFLYTRQAGRIK